MNIRQLVIIICLFSINSACSTVTSLKRINVSALVIDAEKYYKHRKYKQARVLYEKILLSNPDHLQSSFRLANIHAYSGNRKEAISYYRLVLQRQPQHIKSHYNLSMLYLLAAQEHLFHYLAQDTLPDKKLNLLLSAIEKFNDPVQSKSNLDQLADMFEQ